MVSSPLLDRRNRLISYQEMFQGTIDGASVHPREVVKEALKQNAAAVILAHPHPSGVAEPSQADEAITTRLRDALSLVDIRVLDHILGGFCSVTTAVKILQSLGFRGINRVQRIPWTDGDSIRRFLGEAKRFYLPDPAQTVTCNSVGNKESVYFVPVGY